METHHWFLMIIMLIVGYALGRMFPQPGQMVGLP